MANVRDIKNRINGVSNTQKITNAMYLISSTKMRKAKAELENTRPYFKMIETEIKRIFQSRKNVKSKYFYPEDGRHEAEKYAYLVVTADKGLAGAYNQNVIKEAETALKKHKKTELYVVGEFGRHYFTRHNIPIKQSFLYTAQNPTFERARRIAYQLLEDYDSGNADEIRIIYSDMENELQSVVRMDRVLPFDRGNFIEKDGQRVEQYVNMHFNPDVETVLNHVIPGYVSGYIYGALVDSFCAEQNARMIAMDNANSNAEELLQDLELEYNRVRQAAITQEITEVAAGAKALKRNRLKEEENLE